MELSAVRAQPVTASEENCSFAVHAIRSLKPVASAYGGDWPWFEMLIRPQGPFQGCSPAEFIDRLYYERATLHTDGEVLRRAVAWAAGRSERTRISVNTHPESLTHQSFVQQALRANQRLSAQGHSLCLELIEFGRCESRDRLVRHAQELRRAGVMIALDDFGSRINCFDLCAAGIVDLLKIDLRLIQGVETDRNLRAVVDSLVTLGRGLRAGVVAEGIETATQAELLEAMGVDYAQGFYFHKPQTLGI